MVQESLFFHIIFVYKVNTITWKICSKHCSILESCVSCLLQVQIQYSNSPTIDMSSNISTVGILLFAHPITTYQNQLATHALLLIKDYCSRRLSRIQPCWCEVLFLRSLGRDVTFGAELGPNLAVQKSRRGNTEFLMKKVILLIHLEEN